MVRIIIAGIVGGIILMVWGAVSWTALHWHNTSGGQLANEKAVVEVLRSGDAEAGTYWIPGIAHEPGLTEEAETAMFDDWTARHRAGPVALLIYHPEGKDPMAPAVFAAGFGASVLAALIAAFLLSLTSIPKYIGRVLFLTTLGLLIAVDADLGYAIFLYFHTDWTIVNALDQLIGWTLAGMAMAAIVKGRG